jgi:hypothetical protein
LVFVEELLLDAHGNNASEFPKEHVHDGCGPGFWLVLFQGLKVATGVPTSVDLGLLRARQSIVLTPGKHSLKAFDKLRLDEQNATGATEFE